ncbi:GntR family transcriptional regulator [Microbacterium invictum]|jgi:DNA-binding GntR family transcriptional regulator|uniref:GntR family transcriptional regulator n=1 Tax=Microbacterium invictum TaxID=515415 RepID=A0ABZ0VBS9_9MICO|nr:GntR family transcriptional regulator [Microbacterium invictum]WQB71096.1 GntR family transcriptional regulator [Microbacterium invictum]
MAAQFEEAVERLRQWILDGTYGPGAKLGAAEVASALGMSRTPVREAFRILSMEGLVELTSNRGARVAIWEDQELDTVFETRIALEGLACRLAADRITAAQVDQLAEIAQRIVELGMPQSEEDMQQIHRLNGEFHGAIIAIAGSDALGTAMGGIVHAAILTRTRESYDETDQTRSAQHHVELVAALRAGDGRWAQSVMTSHLLAARASLLGPRRTPA